MTLNPTYPITGIQDGLPPPGSPAREVPLRVEVDDFYTREEYAVQRNLFLLAMAKFKAMDTSTKLSYFQVAGIHGMPLITWDDPLHPEPVPARGYCPHNLITFPTWHRPYMVLFEQRVYEIMVNDIIPTFDVSQQALLKAEASKWRLPYWDWAAKKKRGDKEIYDAALILKDKNVTVFTSTGETSIPNPIWEFSTSEPMGNLGIEPLQYQDDPPKVREFIDYQLCTATSKVPPGPDPVASGWTGGVQNVADVAKNIQDAEWYQKGEGNYTLGEAVYRLLSLEYITSYRQFASARYEPKQNPRDALSWEGIHNNLHNWIGGEWGHMGNVPLAAFDPIFWMHHANIDRVFAIYQALYPSEKLSWWVKDETIYTDDNGNDTTLVLTPESLLAPFHKDTAGATYDSNGVRHIADLGYTYPELQPWKFASDIEYRINIFAQVRKLYAPHSKILAARADYIVNVVYERFALGGIPFTIQVLLNDKIVGSVYSFSSTPNALGAVDGCENCLRQQQSKILSSGQITLTGALLASIDDAGVPLDTLDKDVVKPYLQAHLKHRVVIVRRLYSTPSGS
ncbi:hypothetical protein B0H11DRAFT_1713961 [Mycena galericulata]|nr:hypothetical protein B0H11DRAFT_1713961 [Mycena galericulata]